MSPTPESRLLELYDRVAEAPDAIERMRKFVLDVAVRGKLVEQNPSDEPAEKLLERIEAAKKQQGQKWTTSPLRHEDEPFELPACWRWTRVGEICSKTGSGSTPRGGKSVYRTSGVPFLRSQNVHNDGLRLDDVAYVDPQTHEKMNGTRVFSGDLLLNITGGSIGRCARVPNDFGDANVSQHVAIIRPAVKELDGFLHILILSPYFQSFIFNEQTGAGRGGLPKYRMDKIPVALPPLPEQHRIVAKVDELMTLLDHLETTRTQRETARDRLTTASLTRLIAPETTEKEFRAHARFAISTLPTLTAHPEQIKTLRQTILDLAVRGKLVKQDPADEAASELLKRIAIRRSALLGEDYPNPAEAKTQKKKQAQQNLPTDLPELPPGWTWSTFQQCSLLVIDCKNKTAPYSASGIKLIRTTNVRHGALNSNDQKFVSEEVYETWSLRAKPEAGDILITREAPMGEVCIIPEGERICLGQRMMLVRLVPATIDSRFMLYSLRDPDLMERVQDKPLGMTVQHLRVGGVETLLVPLPPLAEQHRIVLAIDAIMSLCDRLEAALTTANTNRARLLKALLHDALNVNVRDKEAA